MNKIPRTIVWSGLSKLTKAVVVVVLGLWALATLHCDLEQVPGLTFLAWCHPQETAPQQAANCDDDACSEVESALYRVEQDEAVLTVPVLALSFLVPAWEITTPTESVTQPVRLLASPPELPRVWQFAHRTALPPRAPSLLA